jgi:signal peptidase I
MKSYVRELLITLALAAVIFIALRLVIQSSEVFDVSMQNTLIAGQRLIVIKTFFTPERGDIIVIYPPMENTKQYVKRLIGLPGDTVEVHGGKVYVDNVALVEPYIKAAPAYTMSPVTLGPDQYFVLGDNRNNSTDSHFGWTVTRSEIVGKAWLRFWPFNKFGNPGNYDVNAELATVNK